MAFHGQERIPEINAVLCDALFLWICFFSCTSLPEEMSAAYELVHARRSCLARGRSFSFWQTRQLGAAASHVHALIKECSITDIRISEYEQDGKNTIKIYDVEVEVNLRPTVCRPVCLGVGLLSGTYDQIFLFCLTI
jgi:hypothetical protein